MSNKTKTPGTIQGEECHCRCHYDNEVRHIVPCCDRCYEQYDQSIWRRETVVSLLKDAYASREDVATRLNLKNAKRAIEHLDELITKYEEWLTKP